MEYSNSRVREIIAEWVHSERDRDIMVLRLCHEKTIEEIAEHFDMSDRQIRRIVKKLSVIVFSHY